MRKSNLRSATVGLLLAALVVAAIAPAADAGRKYRYKGHDKHRRHHVERVVYQPSTVVYHHSSAGPALAFIGGVVLGAVISNAHHATAVYADDYYFYDTYCSQRFVSLEVYYGHLSHHHHPNVVRVFHAGTGHWVDTVHYSEGHWAHYEGNW
jgi:hypothetical protein